MEISQINPRKENLGQMISAVNVEEKSTGKPHLNVQNANKIVMVAIQQKISVDGLKSLGEQEVEKVLIAAEGKLKNDGLILDCGAMAHMFSDKRYFTILKPKAAGHFVTIGGHNQVPVKGRGSIHFYVQLNNAYHNINLNNILYIPELEVNLVSL